MTLSIKYCLLYKRLMSWLTINPRLEPNSDTVKKVLRQPDLDPNELAEYKQLWTQKYWMIAVVIMWSILVGLKYLFILVLTFKSLDYINSDNNLKSLAPDQIDPRHGPKQFSFSCLRTNCSRPLSGPRSQGLAHDLRKLPYLYLCNPNMANTGIYGLWDTLDIVAFINQTAISIAILVVGLFYPIQQLVLSNFNELLMFIVAPKATLHLVQDKMATIYREFIMSFLNFRTITVKMSHDARRVDSSQFKISGHSAGDGMQIRAREKRHELVVASSLRSSHLPNSIADKFVLDCMPAIRTEWWRQKAATTFTLSSFFNSMFIILIECGICVTATYFVHNMAALKVQIKAEMERQQCAVWLAPKSGGQPTEFVDVQDPLLRHNPFVITEYGTCFFLIMLYLGGVVSMCYTVVAELNLWILELEFKLALAIELLRLHNTVQRRKESLERFGFPNQSDNQWQYFRHNHHHSFQSQPQPPGAMAMQKFSMAQVRDMLIKSAQMTSLGVFRLSLDGFYRSLGAQKLTHDTSSNAKIAFQMYATKLLQESEEGAHIECLEKVYLNFRLFVDLLHAHGRIVAPLVLLSHMLTYFFAFVGVYYTRNVRDFTYEALLIIIALMIAVSLFISFGAAFHPRAMRLLPLVWSLIAQITCMDDPKLEHLRLLWLKLEDVLDNEGGIYLKALGVSFSYTSVVQLTLGTSTIMILALKD